MRTWHMWLAEIEYRSLFHDYLCAIKFRSAFRSNTSHKVAVSWYFHLSSHDWISLILRYGFDSSCFIASSCFVAIFALNNCRYCNSISKCNHFFELHTHTWKGNEERTKQISLQTTTHTHTYEYIAHTNKHIQIKMEKLIFFATFDREIERTQRSTHSSSDPHIRHKQFSGDFCIYINTYYRHFETSLF